MTVLTPRTPGGTEIRAYPHSERLMAGKTKRLAKTAVALAATALAKKAVEKAMKNKRVRRTAAELQKVVVKRARATGKVAGKRVKRLVKAAR